MRLTGLHIDRFGIWSDLRMDGLAEGMTVFFGPNEAGKSTLMQYIRTMLYGFHPERCRRFVTERRKNGTLIQPDGRLGGSLFVACREGEYHVRRHADERDPLGSPGDVKLMTHEGERHGANRLSTLLNGIDEAIFNNVFAVGLREMQAIGGLNETQAARQLYSLSTGADRVSLVDVSKQLRATQCRLVGCDDRESLLVDISREQDGLNAELASLRSHSARWAALSGEQDALNEEMERLELQRAEADRTVELAAMAMRVEPKWEESRRVQAEIEAFSGIREVSRGVLESLREMHEQLEKFTTEKRTLEARRVELIEKAAKIPVSDALVRLSARAAAMMEQQVSIGATDERVASLTAAAEEVEFEIHAEQERLGLAGDPKQAGILPKMDVSLLMKLHEPARALQRDQAALEIAQQEAKGYQADAQRVGRELAVALGKPADWFESHDQDDVVSALETTTNQAAGIRRLDELEKKLGRLTRQLQSEESRREHAWRSQLLPWDLVRAFGAMFAFGAVLFLCGLFGGSFGWSDQGRGLLLLSGTVVAGLAIVLKLALDNPARDGLRGMLRETELIQRQIADAESQRDDLMAKLPGRRGNEALLRDTRTRLVKLEALMPLEHQRRALLDMADQAERRAVEINSSMKESHRRWEESLRSLGLSTQWTPTQMQALSGQTGSLMRLHERLTQLQTDLEQAGREQAIFAERLGDLLSEVAVEPDGMQPSEQLAKLREAIDAQNELRIRRERMLEESEKACRQIQDVEHAEKRLQRRCEGMIMSAGAIDHADLQKRQEQWQKRNELREQLRSLEREIDRMFPDRQTRGMVESELERQAGKQLASRLKQGQQRVAQTQSRMKELQYRHGEIGEQIRQLAADKQFGRIQMQMGILDLQMENGIQKWKTVSAMAGMLKSVYKKYEKERQPDTLKEASQYLAEMTGGKYARIWTPLAEDVLLVDDAEERSFPVEMLSRGTREQLFLCLRLALITCYAQRGIKMPLVLDDVLVNFDAERTQAAAKVLVDFSRAGYQVLVFTCHQHIRDIFEGLQVDVRELRQTPQHPQRAAEAAEVPAEAKHTKRNRTRKVPTNVVLGYADLALASRNGRRSRTHVPPPTASDSTILGFWESTTTRWNARGGIDFGADEFTPPTDEAGGNELSDWQDADKSPRDWPTNTPPRGTEWDDPPMEFREEYLDDVRWMDESKRQMIDSLLGFSSANNQPQGADAPHGNDAPMETRADGENTTIWPSIDWTVSLVGESSEATHERLEQEADPPLDQPRDDSQLIGMNVNRAENVHDRYVTTEVPASTGDSTAWIESQPNAAGELTPALASGDLNRRAPRPRPEDDSAAEDPLLDEAESEPIPDSMSDGEVDDKVLVRLPALDGETASTEGSVSELIVKSGEVTEYEFEYEAVDVDDDAIDGAEAESLVDAQNAAGEEPDVAIHQAQGDQGTETAEDDGLEYEYEYEYEYEEVEVDAESEEDGDEVAGDEADGEVGDGEADGDEEDGDEEDDVVA